MVPWCELLPSGVVPDALGAGRYFCYVSAKSPFSPDTICTCQIVFGEGRVPYIWTTSLQEFISEVWDMLWDPSVPTLPFSGIAADAAVAQYLQRLRTTGSTLVLLQASLYQRSRKSGGIWHKFKKVN